MIQVAGFVAGKRQKAAGSAAVEGVGKMATLGGKARRRRPR
jgi:hypothetical protein